MASLDLTTGADPEPPLMLNTAVTDFKCFAYSSNFNIQLSVRGQHRFQKVRHGKYMLGCLREARSPVIQ